MVVLGVADCLFNFALKLTPCVQGMAGLPSTGSVWELNTGQQDC